MRPRPSCKPLLQSSKTTTQAEPVSKFEPVANKSKLKKKLEAVSVKSHVQIGNRKPVRGGPKKK